MPEEAPPPTVLDLPIASLRAGDPLRWLRLGWADFVRSPIGLFYGVCFFLMGHALLAVFQAALSGVYSAAVYRYAVDGQAPQGFTGGELQAAFRPK